MSYLRPYPDKAGNPAQIDVGTDEVRRLAARYCWDMKIDEALEHPGRVILRAMNLGTWDDVLAIERTFGNAVLRNLIEESTIGALSPKSWSFWHYRLGITGSGMDVPTMPIRVTT